jgi:hypothetical protein
MEEDLAEVLEVGLVVEEEGVLDLDAITDIILMKISQMFQTKL